MGGKRGRTRDSPVNGSRRSGSGGDDDDDDEAESDVTCQMSKLIILVVGFSAVFYLFYILYFARGTKTLVSD